MKKLDTEILDIASQASLKILADDKILTIKHKFRFGDKSIWGVPFFFCGGIFLTAAPFIKTSDTTSKILGIVIGLALFTLSLFTFIRQFADKLKITDREIIFHYKLKLTSMPIDKSLRIIMKTEIMKISRVGAMSSTFILVTHYLQTLNNEIPILNFQMNNSNAQKAMKLGNEITRICNKKLQQVN